METLLKDIRYGIRNLLKHPTFAATALITLAIGIGANTTIFSFVNGILLRPLPYPQSERLTLINETALKRGIPLMSISFPNFLDWREQNHVFEDVAAYGMGRSVSLTGVGQPERIRGVSVSQGTFELLRVAPILGRTFSKEEDKLCSLYLVPGYRIGRVRTESEARSKKSKVQIKNEVQSSKT